MGVLGKGLQSSREKGMSAVWSGQGGEIEGRSVEPEGWRCRAMFGEGGGEESIGFLLFSDQYDGVRRAVRKKKSLPHVDPTECVC